MALTQPTGMGREEYSTWSMGVAATACLCKDNRKTRAPNTLQMQRPFLNYKASLHWQPAAQPIS